jgi:uncharacterized protein YukE
MARADANSDEMKAFAKELKRFEANVSGEVRRLKSRFGSVHWRDSARGRFEADLDQMLKAVTKAASSADPLAKSMNKKAAELDRYLGK